MQKQAVKFPPVYSRSNTALLNVRICRQGQAGLEFSSALVSFIHIDVFAMKKRINLTINEELIDRMKSYADLRETSISNIVEEHFQKLLAPQLQRPKISLLEFVK